MIDLRLKGAATRSEMWCAFAMAFGVPHATENPALGAATCDAWKPPACAVSSVVCSEGVSHNHKPIV
jgi:hypothetical protein